MAGAAGTLTRPERTPSWWCSTLPTTCRWASSGWCRWPPRSSSEWCSSSRMVQQQRIVLLIWVCKPPGWRHAPPPCHMHAAPPAHVARCVLPEQAGSRAEPVLAERSPAQQLLGICPAPVQHYASSKAKQAELHLIGMGARPQHSVVAFKSAGRYSWGPQTPPSAAQTKC